MVYFLYHLEPYSGIPIYRPLVDQILGYMFGFTQVIIDRSGKTLESAINNPMVFKSFEEAKNHPQLAKLKWVYFHAHAKKFLQDYTHPADDVIYCVGSDWTGFGLGPDELDGDVLRLAAPDPDADDGKREFHAASIIPLVAYDRALKLWQHQHSPTI